MKSILYIASIAGLICLSIVFLFPASPFVQTSDAQVNETSDVQSNSTFKTYENPNFGLSMSYPSAWSVEEYRNDPEEPADNSIVVIFKTESQGENDKYLENVIINVQGPTSDIESLETYRKESIQSFRSMSDIKITESMEDTLSGFPAHQLQYTSRLLTPTSQDLNLKKIQVFTVLDNVAYVVTYAAEQAEYDKNVHDAENLIKSIKIDREALKI
jgi:serine/threonine-protein kinase